MAYFMWALAASFYFYQFILRVSSSVLVKDLMETFHLDASGVGMLSSLALYTYASLQVPAGLLADFLGVRKVLLVSALLCILGNVVFSFAPDLLYAQIGRLLIGAGSAASFLSVSKVVVQWFPVERHSSLFGMTMTAGTVGALNGSAPLSFLVARMGWRNALGVVSGLGIFIFLSLTFFLKEKRAHKSSFSQEGSKKNQFPLLLAFFQNPVSWIYGVAAFGCYLAVNVISDLWGPSFLMQAYPLSLQKASQSTSLLYVGLCVGSLFLTWFIDRLQCKRVIIQASLCLLSLFSTLFVLGAGGGILPLFVAQGLLFVIGFLGAASMLCFSCLLETQSSLIGGTVVGFVNSVVMLFGALAQQATSWILDYTWMQSRSLGQEALSYGLSHYQSALFLTPLLVGFSALLSFGLPKKKN